MTEGSGSDCNYVTGISALIPRSAKHPRFSKTPQPVVSLDASKPHKLKVLLRSSSRSSTRWGDYDESLTYGTCDVLAKSAS